MLKKTATARTEVAQISMKNGEVEFIEFIVGELYDFLWEDLLVHDELAGQIDASKDNFTPEVHWLRLFLTSDS